jgi:hypothetical protein
MKKHLVNGLKSLPQNMEISFTAPTGPCSIAFRGDSGDWVRQDTMNPPELLEQLENKNNELMFRIHREDGQIQKCDFAVLVPSTDGYTLVLQPLS